jgi:hypothetical protein
VHAHDAPLKLVCSGWRKSFGGEPSTGQMVQCARTWHAHGTSGSIKIGRAGYGRSRGGTLAVDDHVSFRPLRAPGRSGQGSGWFCFAGVVRSRRPKCAPAKGFRQTKPAAPGGPPFFYFFTIGGAPVFGFVISSRAERPSPRPRHADAVMQQLMPGMQPRAGVAWAMHLPHCG